MTYFQGTISTIGPDAEAMAEGGVLILFGAPCPDALAEVSFVVDDWKAADGAQPSAGDTITIGESTFTVTEVGGSAADNLRDLGHAVLYINPAEDFKILPGATLVTGDYVTPVAGAAVTFQAG